MGSVALVWLSTGCASLMMHVTDVDDAHADLQLKKGDSANVPSPSVDLVVEDKKEGSELASKLRSRIVAQLKDEGISTDDHSETKIVVKITKYETGCGFCRGFFPVFGLGDSFVDGEASLVTPSGKRTLKIEKTGQATGMGEMGDQTDTNMDYFAKVLASNLTSPGKKKESASKETAKKE
jgi:hypothetical protein